MTNVFRPHSEAEEILAAAGCIRQCLAPSVDSHFQLKSGDHTAMYIDCTQLYRQQDLMRQVARLLLAGLPECVRRVQCIAVASERARPMAQLLAESLCDGKVITLPEPRSRGVESLCLHGRARDAAHRSRTLLFDDVIFSGRTLMHLRNLVRDEGGYVLPTAITVVDRRSQKSASGMSIRSLMRRTAVTWRPEDCPLCKRGSPTVSGHE